MTLCKVFAMTSTRYREFIAAQLLILWNFIGLAKASSAVFRMPIHARLVYNYFDRSSCEI